MPNERKRTLWEKWQEERKQTNLPPELQLPFNPLGARLGDFAMVSASFDEEDLTNNTWRIGEIDVWRRDISDQTFYFADYILYDKEDGELKRFVLRVMPSGDPSANGHPNLQVLLLQQDGEEMEYDQGLHEDVLPTGVLEVRDNGRIIATYRRLADLEDPYDAEVTCMEEPDNPYTDQVSYWDFYRPLPRITQAKEGEAVKDEFEYYIVELDQESGMFKFWRGIEISPTVVNLIQQ